MKKINLGCGPVQPDGWVNVDYALGARLSKIPLFNFINDKIKMLDLDENRKPRKWSKETYIHNLNRKFSWNDQSIDTIYCSHTLEHFSKQEGKFILQECFRVLKADGILRIVVPDLKSFVMEYVDGNIKADEFLEKIGVLYEKKRNPLKNLFVPITQFPHRCMYDTNTLLEILNAIGFSAEIKKPFTSSIVEINTIELPERTEKAVIIEGKKY
ncbi:MAG: hypothetical protein STSR0008_22540 [Ignavibacterium sp.]